MDSKGFFVAIAVRITVLLLALLALTYTLLTPGFYALSLICVLIVLGLIFELTHFIASLQDALVKFLTVAGHADASNSYDTPRIARYFPALPHTMATFLQQQHRDQLHYRQALAHSKALIEQIPVPLLSIDAQQQVQLRNQAARRFFGHQSFTSVEQTQRFGQDFYRALSNVQIAKGQVVNIEIDRQPHRVALSASRLISADYQETLVSLISIQSVIDQAQIQAWQELVGVLTHEIMNSITPVTSLAQTALVSLSEVRESIPPTDVVQDALADASEAVNTLAKRSESLTRFVTSYRQLTRLPSPQKQRFRVQDLFRDIELLFTSSTQNRPISFSAAVIPEHLELNADKGMLEQSLLNLLKNAEQAVAEQTKPHIRLNASLNRKDRVVISVSDNGCGISAAHIQRVFIPFFTTKKHGSGVGLAFTRQVMLLHGGIVTVSSEPQQETVFTLTFA